MRKNFSSFKTKKTNKKAIQFLLIKPVSQLDEAHLPYLTDFFNSKSTAGYVNHIYKLSPKQHVD